MVRRILVSFASHRTHRCTCLFCPWTIRGHHQVYLTDRSLWQQQQQQHHHHHHSHDSHRGHHSQNRQEPLSLDPLQLAMKRCRYWCAFFGAAEAADDFRFALGM